MSIWIAAFVAVAAIAATYFFCVRPGLRGSCGPGRSSGPGSDADRQLAELREELRVLRAQDALDSGRVPGIRPAPPADG